MKTLLRGVLEDQTRYELTQIDDWYNFEVNCGQGVCFGYMLERISREQLEKFKKTMSHECKNGPDMLAKADRLSRLFQV